MPTYDYECLECGHTFEVFHGISSTVRRKCPKCGSNIKKLISGGCGLLFKGSGFYITDYKKGGSKENKSSDKAKESGGETNQTTKETKLEDVSKKDKDKNNKDGA